MVEQLVCVRAADRDSGTACGSRQDRSPRPTGRVMALPPRTIGDASATATRRQQPVGRQQQQHLVPTCPLAAQAEPLGPEPIERQFTLQVHRQPASAPLPRPAQPQLGSFSRTTAASGSTAAVREQRQRARSRRLPQGLHRLAPRKLLRIVDLAQVQQRPLHHTVSAFTGDLLPQCSNNGAPCRPSCAWCAET